MVRAMYWNYCAFKRQVGEILGLKRLEHSPEAYWATKEADLKGEFGFSVALSLVLIPLIARAVFDSSFSSILILLLAFLFCQLARARQEFFHGWLAPQTLLTVDRLRN
jgi:hypothetical protein